MESSDSAHAALFLSSKSYPMSFAKVYLTHSFPATFFLYWICDSYLNQQI